MPLIEIIQAGGPLVLAMVLAFLYWAERTERQEAQKALADTQGEYLERMINGMNAAAQATREASTAIQTQTTTIQTVLLQYRKSSE